MGVAGGFCVRKHSPAGLVAYWSAGFTENNTEHDGENQQSGKGLQKGPDPTKDAGAVTGGEVAVGERPDQRPALIQVTKHAWGAVYSSLSLTSVNATLPMLMARGPKFQIQPLPVENQIYSGLGGILGSQGAWKVRKI